MTKPPTRTLSDFTQALKAKQRRVPLQGTVETTYRCNLKCAHCYVNLAPDDAEARASEVPLVRLISLVDELADAGTLELLFTGGEVLLRDDFPELYRHAVRRGLFVILFTNGTLITERLADLLGELKPLRVEITLYGMSQATYEKVTGVPGSHAKCLAGIERLLARNVPLKLKTMVLSWNLHEVEAMQAYAVERGVDFKFDGFLNKRVDCGADRTGELQVDPEKLLALDLANPNRMAEFQKLCDRILFRPAAEAKPPQDSPLYTCGAGNSSFTVEPSGKLLMCQLSRKASFDLKQGRFEDGWFGLFPRLRERTWQTEGPCRTCNLGSLCASCPGAAELENGNPESLVEAFCETTHLRAFALMGEKSGHRRDGTCCLGTGRLAAKQAEAKACAPKASLVQLRIEGKPL